MAEQTEVYRMRLGRELQRKASKQAKSEQRTLASLIRFLLDRYLAEKAGK